MGGTSTSVDQFLMAASVALKNWRPDLGGHDDVLMVDHGSRCMEFRYIARSRSPHHRELAQVHIRIGFEEGVLWICNVTVGEPFRACGLGRRLVNAVEGYARRIRVNEIRLYPLWSARAFWHKLGYLPHPRAALVLSKPVP